MDETVFARVITQTICTTNKEVEPVTVGDSVESSNHFEYSNPSQHSSPATMRELSLCSTYSENSDTNYAPRDIDPKPFEGEEVSENI